MAKRIRKFVDRAFSRTVDLSLLRRLLDPYAAAIGFEWSALPDDDRERREAIFELFRTADGRFPAVLQFTLFNIATLANEHGATLLKQHADQQGVQLVPVAETSGAGDGRHLNPRHIALLAFLDQKTVFDRALDAAALVAHSARLELSGRREGVEPRLNEPECCERFEQAVAVYFAGRYQGRYRDVRWFDEDDRVRALVLHGAKASTKNVDADGEEDTLKFREIVQDSIEYDIARGTISVGAKAAPDARRLADLFAEHLLGDAEFFSADDAGNFYTLDPIKQRGADFRFNHLGNDEIVNVRVREIQVDEGERFSGGRRRHSPWAMTVRDRDDALRRLAELAPDVDFGDLRINYVKIEFVLDIDGLETTVLVKVKPPNFASFRDHSHEASIMQQLQSNGLRHPRPSVTLASAAE